MDKPCRKRKTVKEPGNKTRPRAFSCFRETTVGCHMESEQNVFVFVDLSPSGEPILLNSCVPRSLLVLFYS